MSLVPGSYYQFPWGKLNTCSMTRHSFTDPHMISNRHIISFDCPAPYANKSAPCYVGPAMLCRSLLPLLPTKNTWLERNLWSENQFLVSCHFLCFLLCPCDSRRLKLLTTKWCNTLKTSFFLIFLSLVRGLDTERSSMQEDESNRKWSVLGELSKRNIKEQVQVL